MRLQPLRDGDPRALSALCESRGRAVYAYCLQVAGDAQAMEAAASAFADFRLAVVGAGDLTEREAEALLRAKTRRAAARRGVNAMAASRLDSVADGCEGQEIRLVRYSEGSAAPAVEKVFAAHVADCHLCATALTRLHAGERALERPPLAPLPLRVTDEILWAMALVAPVLACEGNAALVQREALSLLSAPDPANPAQAAPVTPPAAAAAREPDARPEPVSTMPSAADGSRRRFPGRRPRPTSAPMATWGAAFAGAAGAAFGIGLVLLTNDDTTPSRPPTGIAGVAAAATPSVSTTPRPGATASATSGSAGKLRIEAIATTVHPVLGEIGPGARVSVHVRITNGMGRAARARRPVLYVGDTAVDLAAVSTTTATSPIAALDAGAVAEGRLRFDAARSVADELTTSAVRLRISGRSVPLKPVIGSPAAPT